MRVQISASLLSWRRTNPDGQASAANMAPAMRGQGQRHCGATPAQRVELAVTSSKCAPEGIWEQTP